MLLVLAALTEFWHTRPVFIKTNFISLGELVEFCWWEEELEREIFFSYAVFTYISVGNLP